MEFGVDLVDVLPDAALGEKQPFRDPEAVRRPVGKGLGRQIAGLLMLARQFISARASDSASDN